MQIFLGQAPVKVNFNALIVAKKILLVQFTTKIDRKKIRKSSSEWYENLKGLQVKN